MDFGLSPAALRDGLIFFFLLFAVLILRAYAQAWVADRLGDPTPRSDGRVTLYPPPHVDIIGTVVFPLLCILILRPTLGQGAFFFAWTKPVPTNPSYFRHPQRDELFTQLAGFAMCVLIAFVTAVAGGLLLRFEPRLLEIARSLISICAMLIVLDLLPVPPLPGGMLLRHWGVISEEAFWSIARWSGLLLIFAFQLKPVQELLGFLMGLAAWPFLVIFRMVALAG